MPSSFSGSGRGGGLGRVCSSHSLRYPPLHTEIESFLCGVQITLHALNYGLASPQHNIACFSRQNVFIGSVAVVGMVMNSLGLVTGTEDLSGHACVGAPPASAPTMLSKTPGSLLWPWVLLSDNESCGRCCTCNFSTSEPGVEVRTCCTATLRASWLYWLVS